MALFATNKNPSARSLRLFGVVWLPLFLALLGVRVWSETSSYLAASVVWFGAALVSVACLFYLPVARLFYFGATAVTFPIGYVLSHVILGLVFYTVFTPIAIAMRTFGFDPMCRRIDRATSTYWIARSERFSIERYFREY